MTQFWQAKTLAELTDTEWKAMRWLCPLLHGEVARRRYGRGGLYLDRMRFLDQQACRCSRYPERHALVTDCVELSVAKVSEFHWLPKSVPIEPLQRVETLSGGIR